MISFKNEPALDSPRTAHPLTLISGLGILAAIIYNSWPLGYILNPRIARIGLTSDLEASGEAYSWLFVGGDVLFGLLLLVIIWLLLKRHIPLMRQVFFALTGLAAFGVFTAVDALLPVNCTSDIRTCGYQGNQTLGIHDVTGAIAALGLFVGMVVAWRLSGTSRRLKRLCAVVLGVWSVWGLLFVLTPAANEAKLPDIQQIAIVWQQLFLILSGAGTYLIIRVLEDLLRER